jgi:F-type H+-transporting ATPase subunit epsilon
VGTPFHVELVTPERVLFSGEADEVSMRTVEGEITFLARHEDYIGVADVTVVRIRATGETGEEGPGGGPTEVRAAVHGGLVHVDREGVVILAGVAELAAEIDVDRARAALTAAERQFDARRGAMAPPVGQTDAGEGPDQRTPPDKLAAAADAPQAAIRRARVRLEAAGVNVPT